MKSNTQFTKSALSITEQIDLLGSRNLIIQDKKAAEHYLKFISYYRFCGYGIEFEKPSAESEKCYHAGTTFEQILDCYVFDRKLRLLVIDAIERIEVAIRTIITNELALKYGAHWYLDKNLFLKDFKHQELIQSIEKETIYKGHNDSVQSKKREQFINHYYNKYSSPKLPPIWMVAEILSLGTWSNIFAHLTNRQDQKLISKHFQINHTIMVSWLHSLTYLRNLCAHHSKLWSRKFTLKPRIANHYHKQLENNDTFAAQAAILKIFLDIVAPDSQWSHHLHTTIEKHPHIDIIRMGFKENWQSDSFWDLGSFTSLNAEKSSKKNKQQYLEVAR